MYRADDIPELFHDDPEAHVLHYSCFDVDHVREQIEDAGYAVIKSLVPESRIDAIRNFWVKAFSEVEPDGRVVWTPYLGERNHMGFSADSFQYLFRACDFLWNDPIDTGTREVCVRLHALRNLVLREDPYLGMRFFDSRYGIFITASHYPANRGHMELHNDGVQKKARLLHSLVPITFRGRDYLDGGMVIVDRKGREVSPESDLKPGDAILYDGSLKHGVARIVPLNGSDLGRIQIFPIPTSFVNFDESVPALSQISTARLLQVKWVALKNRLRLKAGLSGYYR